MKRIFVLLLLFNIFLISACAPQVTYTDEFPYLPAYGNMVLEADEEDGEEGEENEQKEQKEGEFSKRTYVVENAEIENLLTEYEQILHEDGWTTAYDGKPNMIEVQKDDHHVTIIAYQQNEVTKLDITGK